MQFVTPLLFGLMTAFMMNMQFYYYSTNYSKKIRGAGRKVAIF